MNIFIVLEMLWRENQGKISSFAATLPKQKELILIDKVPDTQPDSGQESFVEVDGRNLSELIGMLECGADNSVSSPASHGASIMVQCDHLAEMELLVLLENARREIRSYPGTVKNLAFTVRPEQMLHLIDFATLLPQDIGPLEGTPMTDLKAIVRVARRSKRVRFVRLFRRFASVYKVS